MKRLCFLAVVAVVASGVMTSARMSATWVLTSGERVSGNINQHTDAKTNISRAQFAVGMPDGTEREVPVDQVAVDRVRRRRSADGRAREAARHRPHARAARRLDAQWPSAQHGQRRARAVAACLRQLRGHPHPHDQPCVHEHGERAAHLSLRARDAAWRGGRGRRCDAGRTRGDRSRGHSVERHRTNRRQERARQVQSLGPDPLGPELGHDQRPRRQPAHQEPGLSAARDERRVPDGPRRDQPGVLHRRGRTPITMPAPGRLLLGINDNELQDNSGAFRVEILRNQR